MSKIILKSIPFDLEIEDIVMFFKKLSPREEKILRMRTGIGEKRVYTLKEIGSIFSVSWERIRQIETQALGKVKRAKALKAALKTKIKDWRRYVQRQTSL